MDDKKNFWDIWLEKKNGRKKKIVTKESGDTVAAAPQPVTTKKPRTKKDMSYHLFVEVDEYGSKKGIIYGRSTTPDEWTKNFNKSTYSDVEWSSLHDRLRDKSSRLEHVQSIGDISRGNARAMAEAHASALEVPVLNPKNKRATA